ncbi:unnamed protein product [Adineta steineri]|uniref:Uncharacterized protein n=1 Tax=Adineta steineri TaxID=433720 RepID=A0A819P5S0_9BILA|nr:unnamed protein product [Adineta steineri]
MVQDNKIIVSSVQSAAKHAVPRHVQRVSKPLKSLHQNFKNNTRSTRAKSNNIINIKIRPSTSTVPDNTIEKSLSVSSISTTRYHRPQDNQSFSLQNLSPCSQDTVEIANTPVLIQHDQPLLKVKKSLSGIKWLSNNELPIRRSQIDPVGIINDTTKRNNRNKRRRRMAGFPVWCICSCCIGLAFLAAIIAAILALTLLEIIFFYTKDSTGTTTTTTITNTTATTSTTATTTTTATTATTTTTAATTTTTKTSMSICSMF